MSEKRGRILVVDDDEDILTAMRLLLKSHVEYVHTESHPNNLLTRLREADYDIVLLDMNLSKDSTTGREGFHWLDQILAQDSSAVVIMITAYGDVDTAVRAIKEGAVDFVLKPWQNEKLLATVNAALRLRASSREVTTLRQRQKQLAEDIEQHFQDIIGQSPVMDQVFETVEKVAKTDANILILGENGTGKELVARAIHRNSLRKEDVFISVDMGSISENLFESEMFGHVRGAFTDAKQDRPGRFEIASKGTLFLDEIGNLTSAHQAKLLTVLENRQVTRVGSNTNRPIDIRLICATNTPLFDLVQQKKFRQDLLYRINTVEIHLPPLRERHEDIPLLVNHYLEHFGRKYKREGFSVSTPAMRKLERYSWPGNVRELKHAIERAVIMSDSRMLQPTDFFFASGEDGAGEGIDLDSFNLEDVERSVILKAIRKHGGNISRAAEDLGLTRTSLYRRIEKYGL
ncbi:MAG: sigma-54 dependent transcriptional regulator [bacterium]